MADSRRLVRQILVEESVHEAINCEGLDVRRGPCSRCGNDSFVGFRRLGLSWQRLIGRLKRLLQ